MINAFMYTKNLVHVASETVSQSVAASATSVIDEGIDERLAVTQWLLGWAPSDPGTLKQRVKTMNGGITGVAEKTSSSLCSPAVNNVAEGAEMLVDQDWQVR